MEKDGRGENLGKGIVGNKRELEETKHNTTI